MSHVFEFGDKIDAYEVRVLNERAVRAGAGILFFLAIISFMNAWLTGNFQPTRVFVVAGLGARCSSDVPPRVEITRQPSKGQVTIQPGIPTTIQYSLSGHCIGTPARGIGINYVSNTGASGEDHFSIAARMPSGGIATRDFKIKIRD